MIKLKVYLAGTISKSDWRHRLIPGLKGHLWEHGPIDTGRFSYTGPFFVACDHGCAHGANTHGAINSSAEGDCPTAPLTRRHVFDKNIASLCAADLVFAYITATDCYGTQGEIGYAIAKGKHVVLCFAPGINHEDFWFWATPSHTVHVNVNECCLSGLLASELAGPEFAARSQSHGVKK